VKTWWDGVVASAPLTSLAAGLGLGGVGYAVHEPGVAASGAAVCAAGLYVERLQARSLRRRRRAERLRARHEVTELRRTIAQLRVDVDAFQRALVDTGAFLAARSLPLLPPVPAPVAAPATPAAPVAAPVVVPVAVAAAARVAPSEEADDVVVPLADVEATAWVQTRERRPLAQPPLPSQAPSPFLAADAAADAAVAAKALYGVPAEADDEAELIGVLGPEEARHVA
jgi:translation initiation factor IF-2